jgi:cytochrome c-type biogenesis protein CcmE
MTLRLPRLRVLVLGAAVVTSLGWVVSNGLTSNLVYYETPSDLLAKGAAAAGERVRLGGLVEAGTVRDSAGGVSFVVTDGAHEMTVDQHGAVPSMFQAGRGVVVEGAYGRDGVFHGDTVMVKHDNVYRPPGPGDAPPHSAKLAGG